MSAWEWDESLYAGSASHYATGRMPYPESLAHAVRDALRLDGSGRLLDVGCGPGSLTLRLAPLLRAAVGIDADAAMVAEGRRRAADLGVQHIEWHHMRAEQLPAGLGSFTVATFAQSFHWMDQETVARRVHGMLTADGACVHVRATTSHGVAGHDPLPFPRPPWDRIDELVAGYIGSEARAGQSAPPVVDHDKEEAAMGRAGFTGPERLTVERAEIVDRSLDELVAAVFSLSRSAPHLFGERLGAFEHDLRRLLRSSSPRERFSEKAREIAVLIWRP